MTGWGKYATELRGPGVQFAPAGLAELLAGSRSRSRHRDSMIRTGLTTGRWLESNYRSRYNNTYFVNSRTWNCMTVVLSRSMCYSPTACSCLASLFTSGSCLKSLLPIAKAEKGMAKDRRCTILFFKDRGRKILSSFFVTPLTNMPIY